MSTAKLFLSTVIFSFLGIVATNVGEANAMEPIQSQKTSSMTHVRSSLDFATVRSNIIKFLDEKKLTLFAEFDHAKNAKEVDLELLPTTVLVFGNPTVGTKLMQEFNGIGMDLPLKIIISQDKDNVVWVSYQNLDEVFGQYGAKPDHQIVNNMQGLLKGIANTTTK